MAKARPRAPWTICSGWAAMPNAPKALCAFCATGAMGFSRNLELFEIAGQVREMKLLSPPKQLTNIVFMGMGEPLMNWKAVDPTLTVLNSERGFGIGARHITVSTVGVLPGIVALGNLQRLDSGGAQRSPLAGNDHLLR